MIGAPHISVLLPEVVRALKPKAGGIYVDGTFGAGGYTRAILAAADCRVFAIDRDPSAAAAALAVGQSFPGRFEFLPGRFGEMAALLPPAAKGRIDGVITSYSIHYTKLYEDATSAQARGLPPRQQRRT